jgi:hypothetical protein
MSTITLIATNHTEKELCNSNELFKIIEQIGPDIIFEEIPPGKFEAVYAGTRQDTLETQAIKPYLQKYPATYHYPVDIDIEQAAEKKIRNDLARIDFICNTNDTKYKKLSGQILYLQETYGFRFLNSDQFSELISIKKTLGRQILDKLKNDENHKIVDLENLNFAYILWLVQNDVRENEMLRNIYSYMSTKKYDKGLFLVGAAHRKPIMQKIQKIESKEEIKLKWTFYNE